MKHGEAVPFLLYKSIANIRNVPFPRPCGVGNRKWCAKISWTGICTLLWCGTRAGSFMLHSKTDSSRSGKKYAVCSLFWHQRVQSYGLQSFSLPRNLLNCKALPKRGAHLTGRTVFQGPVSYPQWWIPIVLQLFAVLWIFPLQAGKDLRFFWGTFLAVLFAVV